MRGDPSEEEVREAVWSAACDIDATVAVRRIARPACTCEHTAEEVEAAGASWHRSGCPAAGS